MKKAIFRPTLSKILLILLLSGCSNDDGEEINCLDILLPIPLNFGYYNKEGNDLLFSPNPEYSVDNLIVFRFAYGKKYTDTPTIEGDDKKFLTIHAPNTDTCTIFIQLKQDVVDTIFYKASINPKALCSEYKIDSVFQNGMNVGFDEHLGIWQLIK